LQISDAQGKVIDQWQEPAGERLLDERAAYLITDILSDNNARAATFGFNSILQIGRPAAVKTGTTTDYRDNWTVGYTPEMVTGVWVGNADNSAMVNLSGVAGAGPIWHEFMRLALSGKPETAFTEPPGLVRVEVCVPSGLLPTPACPATRAELFLEGTAPAAPDNLYQAFDIDIRTGQLADANTPAQFVASRVFLVVPPEAQQWAKEAGLPQPPGVSSATGGSPLALQISSPDPHTVYQITPRLPLASQQVPFRVVAAQPLRSVTFVLDQEPLPPVAAAPFEYWWALAPGTHVLYAEAELAGGERVTSEAVHFTVNPPP
jgi:membrane carboxypeptidase/penicillin-binding protein PbpC